MESSLWTKYDVDMNIWYEVSLLLVSLVCSLRVSSVISDSVSGPKFYSVSSITFVTNIFYILYNIIHLQCPTFTPSFVLVVSIYHQLSCVRTKPFPLKPLLYYIVKPCTVKDTMNSQLYQSVMFKSCSGVQTSIFVVAKSTHLNTCIIPTYKLGCVQYSCLLCKKVSTTVKSNK